ncbi:MAG: ribonuclease III [Alphaproteobacteria bacterium]|nr:MAG: ribonuclease III [Alphaproteobacteria bacterium]
MKLSRELAEFSRRLGHDFADPSLLVTALTHSSMSSPGRAHNQRLEFLGDRVLGLIIAEALLAHDPDAPEGVLAPRFNAAVRKEACAQVATALELGAVLRLGRSEQMSGGRRKAALLADAMEAVIAAVYLDGGFEAARKVVLAHWTELLAGIEADARDPKTALQEWAQARGFAPPRYREVARTGPDHAPRFTIECALQSGLSATAEAGSKRAAEQAAARAVLERIEAGG